MDDRYTGEPAGIPSFQAGKVTRLHQWLEGRDTNLAGAYFYSDSHNDLALLELVVPSGGRRPGRHSAGAGRSARAGR